MSNKEPILQLIKDAVRSAEPDATLILYGSHARGDQKDESDIDVLILVDRESDKLPYDDEARITHPLYKLEVETGTVISPLVYTKKAWANHRVTPFFENVNREGQLL